MKKVPLQPKDIFLIQEQIQKNKQYLILIAISGFLCIVILAWLNVWIIALGICFLLWVIGIVYFTYRLFLWMRSFYSGQKIVYQGVVQAKKDTRFIQVANTWFKLNIPDFSWIAQAQIVNIHTTSVGHLLIWVEKIENKEH